LLTDWGTAITVARNRNRRGQRAAGGKPHRQVARRNRHAMRTIGVSTSVLIIAFGALLWAGYMASEQLWCSRLAKQAMRGAGLPAGE
jgi:uncharacterized iron-regulated membrane protein